MERLFSYGTLQNREVQLETFKRALHGQRAELKGYRIENCQIQDQRVILLSGSNRHPILKYTGKDDDLVAGTVFEITADELAQADDYEVDDYQRVKVNLQSGENAWIYSEANS